MNDLTVPGLIIPLVWYVYVCMYVCTMYLCMQEYVGIKLYTVHCSNRNLKYCALLVLLMLTFTFLDNKL